MSAPQEAFDPATQINTDDGITVAFEYRFYTGSLDEFVARSTDQRIELKEIHVNCELHTWDHLDEEGRLELADQRALDCYLETDEYQGVPEVARYERQDEREAVQRQSWKKYFNAAQDAPIVAQVHNAFSECEKVKILDLSYVPISNSLERWVSLLDAIPTNNILELDLSGIFSLSFVKSRTPQEISEFFYCVGQWISQCQKLKKLDLSYWAFKEILFLDAKQDDTTVKLTNLDLLNYALSNCKELKELCLFDQCYNLLSSERGFPISDETLRLLSGLPMHLFSKTTLAEFEDRYFSELPGASKTEECPTLLYLAARAIMVWKLPIKAPHGALTTVTCNGTELPDELGMPLLNCWNLFLKPCALADTPSSSPSASPVPSNHTEEFEEEPIDSENVTHTITTPTGPSEPLAVDGTFVPGFNNNRREPEAVDDGDDKQGAVLEAEIFDPSGTGNRNKRGLSSPSQPPSKR